MSDNAYSANRAEMARSADTLACSHASGTSTATTFFFGTFGSFLTGAHLF
jgi:hypothetical protein